jgi:xylan 1,4-beta-xylosidase
VKRELINFKGAVPLRLSELNPPDMGTMWHEELCLFLVLWGSAEVTVGGLRSFLKDDDIIAINPNVIYEIHASDCCALLLNIGLKSLGENYAAFDCDSSKSEDKSAFYTLKHLFALFLKENAGGTENNDYFNSSIALGILSELNRHFPHRDSGDSASATKHTERMKSIINYINKNYKYSITLSDIARHMNFSVPYFSKFFKRHFGVGFAEYYNSLRLRRAVCDLSSSERPIEAIAHCHGFSDVRSFVALFKKQYGVLPSAYRKEVLSGAAYSGRNEFESGLYALSKYLHPQQAELTMGQSGPIEEIKRLNAGKTSVKGGTALKHNFRTFTSVGRAKELLYADVQKMLAEFQSEIGYKYIKFHGILSDDMLLYGEGHNGEARYSFVFLDKAIDFLVSVGLKPLVQFSFMPQTLASDKSENLFFSPVNISMPNDMGKWEKLIKAVTEHFIQRYGLEAVKKWLFCVWNEPNLFLWNPYGHDSFFRLYKSTYRVVKRINSGLMFGMPSLAYSPGTREWVKIFFDMCRSSGCKPDFFNIHYYDNDFSDDASLELIKSKPASMSKDRWLRTSFKLNINENALKAAIADLHSIFADVGAGELPVYMTEWNMTVSHRDLLNDTCFKACYLAKNLLENYDSLDSFGHWVITDLIEETQPSNEHFHGGLGLITHSGIKKASYHVFSFLNRLGDKLIGSGDGYFITKSPGKVQLILYNYEHFSHLYASGETFDMSFTKRYAPFLKLARLNVTLTLTDLPDKECTLKEHILNTKHGSAFDAWVEMGALPLAPEDVEYLKRISVPKIRVRREKISDGALDISAELEPLEVRLIEITL